MNEPEVKLTTKVVQRPRTSNLRRSYVTQGMQCPQMYREIPDEPRMVPDFSVVSPKQNVKAVYRDKLRSTLNDFRNQQKNPNLTGSLQNLTNDKSQVFKSFSNFVRNKQFIPKSSYNRPASVSASLATRPTERDSKLTRPQSARHKHSESMSSFSKVPSQKVLRLANALNKIANLKIANQKSERSF